MINIYYMADGTPHIAGDKRLAQRLPYGFKPETFDLTDVSINADNLTRAANDAMCRGDYYVQKYFAMKAAFIEKQRVIVEQKRQMQEEKERRQAEGFDGITSSNCKPVNAE